MDEASEVLANQHRGVLKDVQLLLERVETTTTQLPKPEPGQHLPQDVLELLRTLADRSNKLWQNLWWRGECGRQPNPLPWTGDDRDY